MLFSLTIYGMNQFDELENAAAIQLIEFAASQSDAYSRPDDRHAARIALLVRALHLIGGAAVLAKQEGDQ